MRGISAGLCAALALLTTAAERPSTDKMFMKPEPKRAKRSAQPTTLKGYALGMTLAAFKQRPTPANVDGAARTVCSDDPAVQATLAPALTPRYAGEVVCGFQLLRAGKWLPGQLMLDANHGAAVAFHFYNGLLVQIESQEDVELTEPITQSLTTRFGQPASVIKRVARSLSDAVQTQVVMTWYNRGDTIVMTTPNLGTDRMSVVYTNPGGFAAMQNSGGNIM